MAFMSYPENMELKQILRVMTLSLGIAAVTAVTAGGFLIGQDTRTPGGFDLSTSGLLVGIGVALLLGAAAVAHLAPDSQ